MTGGDGTMTEVEVTLADGDVDRLGALFGTGDPEHERSIRPLLFVRPLSLLFRQAVRDGAGDLADGRAVHARQVMCFAGAPPIGTPLRARVAHREVGTYGLGCGHLVHAEVLEGTTILARTSSVFVVSGAEAATPLPVPPARPARRRDRLATVRRRIDVEDLRAYAELSGDDNPIHLSAAAARAAGLDDVVAHGLFTLALAASQAIAIAPDPTRRLVGASARFSRPLHPGAEVEFSYYSTDEPSRISATVTSGGSRVLRDASISIGAHRS